jgi:predicted Zn-dependent peptidase
MDALYHPNNAVLTIAGGLQGNIPELLRLVKSSMGKWKKGEAAHFDTYLEDQHKPQTLIKYKKTEQAHFCLGFRAFSTFSPKKNPLTILTTILGGGMSSRLFMEVREKRGLCYYISTGRELYQDVGNVVTQAGVTTEIEKIRDAIKVTIEEHMKMADGKVTDEEIERAKNLLVGNLLLSLEDSSRVASFYGSKMLIEKQFKTPEETIDEIKAITKEEVVALAKELFIEKNLNLCLIGPVKDSHAFDDILHIQ